MVLLLFADLVQLKVWSVRNNKEEKRNSEEEIKSVCRSPQIELLLKLKIASIMESVVESVESLLIHKLWSHHFPSL